MAFKADRKEGDIERLWNIFEAVENDQNTEEAFNALRGQFLIKFTLTMGMFWINPEKYLALDTNNRSYLSSFGINISDKELPPFEEYQKIMNQVRDMMASGNIPANSFAELSYKAWGSKKSASQGNAKEETVHNVTCAPDEKMKDMFKSDDSNKQYWWLVGNPKIWSMQTLSNGQEIEYSLYNENGKQRRIFQNFLDAKLGDCVIGYESTPTKQIVALFEVSKANDGKHITFRKTETLASPIDYSSLKKLPELSNMQFFQNPNGSFFKVTEAEYDAILDQIREENPLPKDVEKEIYTKEDFLNDVYINAGEYDRLIGLLQAKRNIILQGAPGVGKTYCSKRLAYSMLGYKDDSKVELVQFHQSYTYEDFIMGYKPNEEGGFDLKRGIFYNFCKKAASDPSNKYFFLIDEINRGNLSKIMGELMMLIENTHRDEKLKLAYSDEMFYVPQNLYIIGMMNTADRSLAMIDYALRRRFSFYEIKPGFLSDTFKKYQESLNDEQFNSVISSVISLNSTIQEDDSLGSGFCIGHSYFCGQIEVDELWLKNVVEYDIIPMLREYWFDNNEKFTEESNKLMASIK